ncbi:pilus assembly protein [Luteimonas sp. MC1782]|uniref:pilus assembly protein n=1 Tax=Luteimonas sp. MC1782 TaxID=2760305 RepID=UPI0016015BAE|nr:PilC/PilY family type IV pilus protein [Luteimonas sp. MC1782]MBB1472615.1 pilus assembly protein [Luteimonas sp. MC1782]
MNNVQTIRRDSRTPPNQRRWWAAPSAFLATMLALPVQAALDIPNDPLTTGARVPPNVLFILDDSGSMAFDAMPADSIGTDWKNRTYVHNSVYYNPAKTYLPWIGANGEPLSGGTSYTSAYGSFNLVGGSTINLGNSSSCARFNKNNTPADTDEFWSGATEVCGGVQTYYVPRNMAGDLSAQANYYRYQIADASADVVRAEYGQKQTTETILVQGVATYNGTLTTNTTAQLHLSPVSPDGVLTISIRNTTGSGNPRIIGYEVYGPDDSRVCNGTVARGITVTCPVSPSADGIYRVELERQSANDMAYRVSAQLVTTKSCDGTTNGNGWINCTSATPTGRSIAAEKTNYATWFSYHRTRMKAAKAGASAAFSELGSNVRVGFRTIWQRNGSQTSGNWPRQNVPIPVEYNDGLFDDVTAGGATIDNRSKWYNRLHGAIGQNGTPLHGALYQAGQYFSSNAVTGPYGPQSGTDQLACRQNFSILTTDGYWNDWSNYASGVRVGNSDGASGTQITEPSTGASFTYSPGAPYSDSHGGADGTLADVAMHYWKRDLRADMRNIVPTTGANPAFWQHMVTFGLSIGLSGNTGFTSVGDVPTGFTGWPDPMPTANATRIDDLLHAAVNSRGTFVAASDPDEFTSGLQAALAAIVERTGSFSNVAANSTAIDTGTRVFQANYVSSVWTGELRSQPVTIPAGVANVDCSGTGQPANGWCASKGIPTSARKIFTSNGHNNGNPLSPVVTSGTTGLAFPSAATTAQLASLNRPGPTISYPVTGAQNAAYIAGARTLELSQGGNLRNRNHLLGDIVGSSPAYVQETNTIYVGANDGMLHAINATNGNELFTFIPGIIDWAALGTLSRPDYAHRYFVDGAIVVTTRQQTPNENILIGALGKGGKGLFALDVTTPGTFGTSDFKWERAETAGGHMGLVQGRPILSKVSGGTNAVVIGNGVNSASNKAALIVLDVDTGDVIREIDTGVGSATLLNGLSAPTGVLGPDGRTLKYVYAGDMLGNLWKFDLSATSPASWSATRLFTATDSSGNAQPISGGVTVATHPTTNKRWLFFGTGRYLTTGDVSSTAVQGMYGFMEHTVALTREDLTERTVTATGTTSNGYPVRSFEARGPLPTGSHGWFIDLPASGERMVQDPQVVSRFLITATMIPSGDACESDGSGYVNALDAFTGTSAGGSYFDLDRDGDTNDETLGNLPVGSVNLGVGMPTLPNLLRGMLVVGGSSGSGLGSPLTLQPRWDRASWREIRGD